MQQKTHQEFKRLNIRQWLLAAAIVTGIHAPAFGFEIYNTSPYSIRAKVTPGDFVEVIPPGEMRSCSYANTDCNPTGEQTAILSLVVETLDSNDQDFMATVELLAGAQAYVHRESRSDLGLEPYLYVDSWNVPGTALVDDTRLGANETQRNVRFLASADCQYQHPGTTAAATDWPVADATNQRMKSMTLNKPNRIRGILYAGDLTQNARRDEWEHYTSQIGSMGEFFYDGMGNHDLANDRPCVTTSPDGCTIRDEIAETIRDRKHRTTKTNKAPGDDPHYSWDWDDVHFVQLNLFPGNAPSPDHDDLDPANALSFLISDLAEHVGTSGRPVVLIHHYGFDSFSTDGWWTANERLAYWNALAPYRVAGIITGHWHLQELSTDWRFDWRRPVGATGGPSEIATFIAGGAIKGVFIDVEINDDDEMIVTRRFNDGRELDSETVLFGPDDVIDQGAPNDTCATAFYLNGAEDLSDLRIVGDDEDWYGVLVPSFAELSIDMTFSHDAGDLDLYVYSDCSFTTLAFSRSTTDNESITWTNPGATTWVLVRALQYVPSGSATVAYDLTITVGEDRLEDNDDCASATPLAAGVHAQLSLEDGDDDWYEITIPAASSLTAVLTADGSHLDPEFEIWDDCGSGAVVTSTPSGIEDGATYENNAPERTVLIRAHLPNGPGLIDYEMSITFAPLSTSSCETAPMLPAGTYSNLNVFDGSDDWFGISTVDNALTTVSVSFIHADGNIDLELRSACDASSYFASRSMTDDEALSYEGNGFGEVIYARVRMTEPGGSNDYTLSITHQSTISGQDDCEDATIISGSREFVYDNHGATLDGDPHPLCNEFGFDNIAQDVWFNWTADATGVATMSICPFVTSSDTKIAVYEGPSCTGQILACNDDACEYKSEVTFDAVSGSVYKLRVGTFSDATTANGRFRMRIDDDYAGNSTCSLAPEFTPGTYPDLVIANNETDWFKVVVPPNTRLTVDATDAGGVLTSSDTDFFVHRLDTSVCPGPSGIGSYQNIANGQRFSYDVGSESRTFFIDIRLHNTLVINYDLKITFTAIDDSFEPNDTCETAADIVEGLYTDLRCGDDDYFAIEMPETSILDVDAFFAQSDGDLSLLVYGPCDQPLTNSNTTTDDESLSYVNTGPAKTVILRMVNVSPGALVPYALNVSVTDIDDCNGNGIDDSIDVANQLVDDCNANGIPDECDLETRYLVQNNTSVDDAVWLGLPDDNWAGIGSDSVRYSFGNGARVVDGPGSDFNVYEADVGVAEFDKISVFVSSTNIFNLVEITATEAPVVPIAAGEHHGDDAFARSYDIAASGFDEINTIVIRGVGVAGPAGGTNGFDLDAIAPIYLVPTGCNVLFDGDLNCDGFVDMFDASLFVTALVDPASFAIVEPFCPMQRADVNRDGLIDGNDAQGFVELLLMP